MEKEHIIPTIIDDFIEIYGNKNLEESKKDYFEDKRKRALETYYKLSTWADDADVRTSCRYNIGVDQLNEWLRESVLLNESTSPENPWFKRGITYLKRFPEAFAYICSYKNPRTHQDVGVCKGFKSEKEFKEFVDTLVSETKTPDISTIFASKLDQYLELIHKSGKEALKEDTPVVDDVEDHEELVDASPEGHYQVVCGCFDGTDVVEDFTSKEDAEAYYNNLIDNESDMYEFIELRDLSDEPVDDLSVTDWDYIDD